MGELKRRDALRVLTAAGASILGVVRVGAEESEHPAENPDSSVAQPPVVMEDGICLAAPVDHGGSLLNPAMGWTMHYYSNITTNYGSKLAPSDTLDWFEGCSTIYLRLPWAYLEPEEGVFNWSIVDGPAQRWIAKGRKIAFRFTTSESWLEYAAPKWVEDAGAKMVRYNFGDGPTPEGRLCDPVYDDPIFLEKLEHFLAAAGARYNGNPDVAFIDVGTFGTWGEGHTLMASRPGEEKDIECAKIHAELHRKYFPDVQLCISDDVIGHNVPGDDFPLMAYFRSLNISLRDDSILVQPTPNSWYHSELAQRFWPHWPVILEHEHLGGSIQRGAWNDDLLVKAVEDYHASYMSIHWWPEVEWEKLQETIRRINRRMGYRLQLRGVEWPSEISVDTPFEVTHRWANVGVAPCYPGGFAAITLKDADGGIAVVFVDEAFDVRSLEVSQTPESAPVMEQKTTFRISPYGPVIKPGLYDVYISIGRRDGTPEIALPHSGDDGGRRYRVGQLTVR